jgi:hypothetical protein
MKTDDMIAGLAARTTPVRTGLTWRRLALAVLVAAIAAVALLKLGWGMRPDLHQAMRTGPFWMKALYTLTLAAAGLVLVDRTGRPGARTDAGMWLAAGAVGAIAVLTGLELARLPMTDWRGVWMGHSAMRCPLSIVILAAPAFVLALWCVRRMAPTRLASAGAAAGLLAGGVGATVYGLSCNETAAAFTAGWYSLGIAVWAGVGALIGPRVLRW